MASYIKINTPSGGTYYYTGSTPASAYQAYQQQVGKGGKYSAISQTAFNQGLSSFGKPSSSAPTTAAKAVVATPKKTAPTTRVKATAAANKKITGLAAKQKTEEQGLINQLKNFISGQEPIPELRTRLATELGIPTLTAQLEPLRQQALRTGQTLLNLPEYVGDIARGQGEARRRLLEETKGAQLERQLRDIAIGQEYFAGQLAGAQGELGQQLTAYGQQFERELVPLTTQLDVFGERAAREVSLYTKAFQNELDAILADITRAEQLSDAERERAFELAKMERQYQMERSLISARNVPSAAESKEATQAAADTKARKDISSQFQNALRLTKIQGADISAKSAIDYTFRKLVAKYPDLLPDIVALRNQYLTPGVV